MTNSFKVKLGEGGFGAVYKGELLSGGPVAVKILNESKGNGEDFINEVASISRTSHVNVVTLVGFCLEGRKKALIYEFMPNGSLDKFIYKKGLETTASLSWDNFWQIAIGIARGLEYLHRGCNTRILHFDIKPHNILLDENFCPKISDFGLAKLCPRKGSIISMSDPRGTIGYVAPEVWNRNFGGVSHKSDVYSYGMMLLEMVGGRNNINAEASHTSEIYFPDWIYKRLEQGGDLRPNGVMATEENEIVKRMTVVGLCLKISDFGLAKLCPRNESVISMSDARRTMGYVAPETWSRHLGGVSHKSDVYNYGMIDTQTKKEAGFEANTS
ncbi:LEAF RUST 10 DISEASE-RESISTANCEUS RECEPTOR-LIKE PROTEIN KINASE-like 2.4 [Glycine max]|uniref:LEAF RUST 10 DISEASE-RESISTANCEUS RECEPTOR-LIKE PROTEIN KINASE-like 2.4 n=1 Tax=Glycine max TaxID=3847 RepID=UPI001B357E97|nr:LEAF RUST 10 DISEASE-RESISTANCE LOCUS RECEPTOR-LIKE PROTEIN KINASE-like 2.4 [Glycine max]